MKMYSSFFELAKSCKRKPNEVFAILSLNGRAYFLFRSNPTPEGALRIHTRHKVRLGNEITGIHDIDSENERWEKLYSIMYETGMTQQFPETSFHAEEHLIQGFPEALKTFKEQFPHEKIRTIDIFLTQSPCSKDGVKRFSGAYHLNNFFLPAGCNMKLSVFFKNKHYKEVDRELFKENTSVRVRYNHKFDPSVNNENGDFLKEADLLLKDHLEVFDRRRK